MAKILVFRQYYKNHFCSLSHRRGREEFAGQVNFGLRITLGSEGFECKLGKPGILLLEIMQYLTVGATM